MLKPIMIKEIIKKEVSGIVKELFGVDLEIADVLIERPSHEFGDYAINIAFRLAKETGKSPDAIASEIQDALITKQLSQIERAETKGGYVNIFLTPEFLQEEIQRISKDDNFGHLDTLDGKTVMIEYTDPNPFKQFHIGHLMSNTIGESLARLHEAAGAKVIRANYFGDIGVHVAKAIWGMKKNSEHMPSESDNFLTKTKFMGDAYAQGDSQYEDESSKNEIDEINEKLYIRSDDDLNLLYDTGKKWSMDAFEVMYARLGTKFDEYFPESSFAEEALEIVKGNPDVFPKSQGALVFHGEEHGLHTRVFVTSKGLPVYESKELALNKKKNELYKLDSSIIVTANEIDQYFKVLLKAMELVLPDVAAKTIHISHGIMRLSEGKMSSRKGTVVTADKFISDIKTVISERIKESENLSDEEKGNISELAAISAIKYSILKQGIGRDIIFDPKQALSFEGDSGPYIQYTYARLANIIRKSEQEIPSDLDSSLLSEESELSLIKQLIEFPDSVARALEQRAPNHVALFLFELSTRANGFYEKVRILDDENEERKKARLVLINSTKEILKKGLHMLGIKTLERM